MSRPWTLRALAGLRALVWLETPIGDIAEVTGRTPTEIDQALWALVGRTAQEALDRLNGVVTPGEPHGLRPRILAVLRRGPATIPELAEILGEDPAHVDEALTEAAWVDLVDATDPPEPLGRGAMEWRLARREPAPVIPIHSAQEHRA